MSSDRPTGMAAIRGYLALRNDGGFGTSDLIHAYHPAGIGAVQLLASDLRAALEPAAMAETLRAFGWTVIPPRDPSAMIPEPVEGQVWVSPDARIKSRTVRKVNNLNVHYEISSGGRTGLFVNNWRAWARKTGARPVENGDV